MTESRHQRSKGSAGRGSEGCAGAPQVVEAESFEADLPDRRVTRPGAGGCSGAAARLRESAASQKPNSATSNDPCIATSMTRYQRNERSEGVSSTGWCTAGECRSRGLLATEKDLRGGRRRRPVTRAHRGLPAPRNAYSPSTERQNGCPAGSSITRRRFRSRSGGWNAASAADRDSGRGIEVMTQCLANHLRGRYALALSPFSEPRLQFWVETDRLDG